MQLIVKEVDGKRQWIPIMNDEEIYEVLCSNVAWRAIGNEKFKVDGEILERVRNITVVIVQRSKEEESLSHLEQIHDPFIKLVLSECNRLGIDLP